MTVAFFFLSILLSVMSDHDGRTMMAGVCVEHMLLKQKEKQLIQTFDKATSVKTIYKQSSGTGIQAVSKSSISVASTIIFLKIFLVLLLMYRLSVLLYWIFKHLIQHLQDYISYKI